jgi:hypothetical protein
VAALTWRSRRSWRRAARHVLAEHHRDTTARLWQLQGAAVGDASVTPAGAIHINVPGWAIALADVSAGAQAAFLTAVRQSGHLSGGGRYGRFWWLEIVSASSSGRQRSVVLGSRLTVVPTGSGSDPDGDRPRIATAIAPVLAPM